MKSFEPQNDIFRSAKLKSLDPNNYSTVDPQNDAFTLNP